LPLHCAVQPLWQFQVLVLQELPIAWQVVHFPPQPSLSPQNKPAQLGVQALEHCAYRGPRQYMPAAQVDGHRSPQVSGPPHLPVHFGSQLTPQAVKEGPWQARPAGQVLGQVPSQPSEPPHLPVQVGVQSSHSFRIGLQI
jgi:hypothetical protein